MSKLRIPLGTFCLIMAFMVGGNASDGIQPPYAQPARAQARISPPAANPAHPSSTILQPKTRRPPR